MTPYSKKNPYADIINLPRHVSKTRTHMSLKDRAAQFAPFSAVVGHGSAVKESARHTDSRRELDESQKESIDIKLRNIDHNIGSDFEVKIVYFKPDSLKSGGKYVSIVGKVEKINKYTKEIFMEEGSIIKIQDIYSITDN